MTAAIHYQPEAYSTSGPKLMGRNAAGESFLRGFFAHVSTNEFWALVQTPEHAKGFAQAAQSAGRTEPIKAVGKTKLAALSQAGTVYYPGPGIGDHAWQRAAYGHGAWSLCGITHTTSSATAMGALADLLTAPVQPWDALICTSSTVKDNVNRVLQAQADYLVQRLGVQKLVLPQLPVIPLGIHTQDFAYSAAPRTAARIVIAVPHPRHDDFLNDPTHVRPITYEGLKLFYQHWNERCIAQGWANSLLGMQLNVGLGCGRE